MPDDEKEPAGLCIVPCCLLGYSVVTFVSTGVTTTTSSFNRKKPEPVNPKELSTFDKELFQTARSTAQGSNPQESKGLKTATETNFRKKVAELAKESMQICMFPMNFLPLNLCKMTTRG